VRYSKVAYLKQQRKLSASELMARSQMLGISPALCKYPLIFIGYRTVPVYFSVFDHFYLIEDHAKKVPYNTLYKNDRTRIELNCAWRCRTSTWLFLTTGTLSVLQTDQFYLDTVFEHFYLVEDHAKTSYYRCLNI
jgi:hypothetical protein